MNTEHTPDELARVTKVQAQYAQMLMAKKNVVGVAVGRRKKNGVYTDELCLVVMVTTKVPSEALDAKDRIPVELAGVAVDVQEVGTLFAQG